MNAKPSRLTRRDKTLGWLSLLLGAVWLSMGCSPTSLGMMLAPWFDSKEPPLCKLAGDKEVTVAVVCTFNTPVTRPELLGADDELGERLVHALVKGFKANKEKVKFAPLTQVRRYCRNMSTRGVVSDHEIGKHCKADYVLTIDVMSMDLYAFRSSQLYQGQTSLNVRVLDMSKPADEGTIFDKPYQVPEFPRHGPEDAGNTRPNEFRARFLEKISRDVSRWFCAYPSDERFTMD